MKYFGKKSLSSFMSAVLLVAWYAMLVVTVLAPVVGTSILFVSSRYGEQAAMTMNAADARDWEIFRNLPMAVKALIFPYFMSVLILLLQIIRKSRLLFANFKNEIVFNKTNVKIISAISRLVIAFSIITFSFSTLLIGVVLLLLCEIIKNGATLQEEIELTV